MNRYLPQKRGDGSRYLEVSLRGLHLLQDPFLNKSTAFPKEERAAFGLEGLLPPHISTMEEQMARIYENFQRKSTNLEKYIHLRALQDRNEVLFYAVVSRYLEEMIPIVYTPTVSDAVKLHSHIFRQARGLYISPENVQDIPEMVKALDSPPIEMIVVTDNQGILGIGDQGVGGMGIPIGKLSLYTLGAGIHPAFCLPVSLDVGTDNEILLKDPLYLGHKHKRLRGGAYDQFINAFVKQIQKVFPQTLVQWEDLSKQNAFSILDRYRDSLLTFNDDIQGTGAVAVAGLINAAKIKKEKLTDQIFCIFGAGAGGIGVARQILNTLITEGLTKQEALDKIFVLDSQGLLLSVKENESYKKDFVKPSSKIQHWKLSSKENISLLEVIQNGKVTALLGLSGVAGSFTETHVKTMIQNTTRPIIFPLSNPTVNAEVTPKEIFEWTEGKAIIATGSPFEPVSFNGKKYAIGQGNNVFIFPGVGLGALLSKAKRVTDSIFTQAAKKLASLVTEEERNQGLVFPPIRDLRRVSQEIAKSVIETALAEGFAQKSIKNIPKAIEEKMWVPEYVEYVYLPSDLYHVYKQSL